MVKVPDKCPKCGKPVISDYGRPYCLNCGESPFSPTERQEWFKTHLHELVKFYITHGKDKLLTTYHLNPQYISHIKGSKLYRKLVTAPAPAAASITNHLPPLPTFSNDWTPEVQIKWLETWAARR